MVMSMDIRSIHTSISNRVIFLMIPESSTQTQIYTRNPYLDDDNGSFVSLKEQTQQWRWACTNRGTKTASKGSSEFFVIISTEIEDERSRDRCWFLRLAPLNTNLTSWYRVIKMLATTQSTSYLYSTFNWISYLVIAEVALSRRIAVSVSSLKDTRYASGTHTLETMYSIFGVLVRAKCGLPSDDWILWVFMTPSGT